MKKKLSLTVGITTCYGDISLLTTVKSIRNSKNIDKFDFIIVSDRVPLSQFIKSQLKKYKVRFIENKKEGSQVDKQKQILKMTKTDLLVFTQDDVLFDEFALEKTIETFTKNPKVTMASIPYYPVLPPNTLFEDTINIGTLIANKIAKYWNSGDNYLSVIGRFMAFKKETLKNFRMPGSVATSDAYFYFENERVGGVYKLIQNTCVYFKNPENIKEHLRKSSRFQYSKMELNNYFKDINSMYKTPLTALVRAILEITLEHPIKTFYYFLVFIYTRILKLNSKAVLNPIWEVDVSTKKI